MFGLSKCSVKMVFGTTKTKSANPPAVKKRLESYKKKTIDSKEVDEKLALAAQRKQTFLE
jgi:hypothetical protein